MATCGEYCSDIDDNNAVRIYSAFFSGKTNNNACMARDVLVSELFVHVCGSLAILLSRQRVFVEGEQYRQRTMNIAQYAATAPPMPPAARRARAARNGVAYTLPRVSPSTMLLRSVTMDNWRQRARLLPGVAAIQAHFQLQPENVVVRRKKKLNNGKTTATDIPLAPPI